MKSGLYDLEVSTLSPKCLKARAVVGPCFPMQNESRKGQAKDEFYCGSFVTRAVTVDSRNSKFERQWPAVLGSGFAISIMQTLHKILTFLCDLERFSPCMKTSAFCLIDKSKIPNQD